MPVPIVPAPMTAIVWTDIVMLLHWFVRAASEAGPQFFTPEAMSRVGSAQPDAGIIVTPLAYCRVIVRCRCGIRNVEADVRR